MRHLLAPLMLWLAACPSIGDVEPGEDGGVRRIDAGWMSDAMPGDAMPTIDAPPGSSADAAPAAFCPIPGCPGASLPAGTDLLGVFAAPSGDVWAVGAGGMVGRRAPDGDAPDAGTWCWCAAAPGTTLRAVWGAASDDVWFVGDAGSVLHFDGSAIAPVDASVGPTTALHDVWGASSDDVYVVGDAGTVRHFDGTAWSARTLTVEDGAAEHALRRVWGASSTQVWAVGRHPNGGGSDAEIFRLQANGGFTREAAFSEQMGAAAFDGLSGSSAHDVWAVGLKFPSGAAMGFAFAAHYDGSAWTGFPDAPEDVRIGRSYTDVAVLPGATWFGASGDTCVRFDGSTWAAEGSATTNLLAIDAQGGRLFATGRGGKILRKDAAGWTTEVAPTVP
jgi:hypothetical protein